MDWGVSNARYSYLIYWKIDGQWMRISENFFDYREAFDAMWNFSAHDYPRGIIINRTIQF